MTRPTEKFGQLLRDPETKWGVVTSYITYGLNIVFLGLYIFGTFEYADQYAFILPQVEFGLALFFLFEYVSRIDYADNTWAEIKSPYSIADLLAIIPALAIFIIPAAGQLAVLRSIQILRVFRFLRLGLENKRVFNYALSARQVVVAEAMTAITIILNLHAGLVYELEAGVNPQFQNFGDAFYYSVVSLTTTGFGNVVPQTRPGQAVTSVGLVAAITVIPWIVFRGRKGKVRGNKCPRCRSEGHKTEANYCYECGEDLTAEDVTVNPTQSGYFEGGPLSSRDRRAELEDD
ncbi:MAG: ion channel [uncultured archaeon A07HR60]|nr:MAG: ion channel [uncultured archaeon A07HR60]